MDTNRILWPILLLAVVFALASCRTQWPLPPYPDDPYVSLVEEQRVPLTPFVRVMHYTFSPDRQYVAVAGASRANYEPGEDPDSIIATDLILVLEWPTLSEVQRISRNDEIDWYEPGQLQWSPDGSLLWIWTRQKHPILRLHVQTGELSVFPRRHAGYVVSLDGTRVIAWGRYNTYLQNGRELPRWLVTDEIFLYDASDFTLRDSFSVPGIDQIGAVFALPETDEYLIAAINACQEEATNWNKGYLFWDEMLLFCDTTLFDFTRKNDRAVPVATLEAGKEREHMPRRYHVESGLILTNQVLTIFDVNQDCLVFQDRVYQLPEAVEWYDAQHIAEIAWATIDDPVPEIVIYRIPELESGPTCIPENGE